MGSVFCIYTVKRRKEREKEGEREEEGRKGEKETGLFLKQAIAQRNLDVCGKECQIAASLSIFSVLAVKVKRSNLSSFQ